MPLTIDKLPVAQLLKQKTLPAHKESESLLAPRLGSIRGYGDYAAILKMFYGYFHPLEKEIRRRVDKEQLADIDERRNSDFIIGDLKAIGHYTEPLPLCTSLPSIDSLPAAFGALYVLEGSTLGGRMIARMLAKNSAVAISDAQLRFFNGYGEQTGARWMVLQSALDRLEEEADAVVTAANETFHGLTQWMEQTL